MKLSIIIPVFNEATTLETILRRVWEHPLPQIDKEIIIVESNSTDGSREITKRVIETLSTQWPHVSRLVLQDKARGKGNAVREGLDAATGDIILIQDADLEYDVNDYAALLKPIIEGRTKFVLGSRHLSTGNWKIRAFKQDVIRSLFMNIGGLIFHCLFNIIYLQRLTDPTTMYKVFRRDCIKNLYLVSERFDFDFELLAKLIRSGFNPIEIPVSYCSRGFSEGKKIRVFSDPFTWIIAIFRFRFGRLYKKSNHENSIPKRLI